ncbi:hypothetical protein LTR17_006907 [Elasticomyces elasticus]|nr:hypothetical protein LTR17_006907 [Elasticomyces elasticus]
MPAGSCLCGEVKIAYTGEPVFTAICYCNDDRKMSNTQTFQIPQDNFKVTAGQPKTWEKVSDHGHDITTHFCPTCGTALYRTGGATQVQGMIGLRAGVLDDQTLLNDNPPKIEVYVERRPKWIAPVSEATQLDSKYQIVTHGAAG